MTRNSNAELHPPLIVSKVSHPTTKRQKAKRLPRWDSTDPKQKEAVLVAYTKYPLKDETN